MSGFKFLEKTNDKNPFLLEKEIAYQLKRIADYLGIMNR